MEEFLLGRVSKAKRDWNLIASRFQSVWHNSMIQRSNENWTRSNKNSINQWRINLMMISVFRYRWTWRCFREGSKGWTRASWTTGTRRKARVWWPTRRKGRCRPTRVWKTRTYWRKGRFRYVLTYYFDFITHIFAFLVKQWTRKSLALVQNVYPTF